MKKGYIKVADNVAEFQAVIDRMKQAEVAAENIEINKTFEQYCLTLQPGDTLMVVNLSIFGTTKKMLEWVIELAGRGVQVQSLDEPWFKILPENVVFLQGLTEMSRRLRAQCTRDGLEKAKANGKKLGRPTGSTKIDGKVLTAMRIRKKLGVSVLRACEIAGCEPRSYYRYLKKESVNPM